MPQPADLHPPRSTARAAWREDFIRRQLAGLKDLGLSDEALRREDALLRGGFLARAGLFGAPDVA